MEADTENFSLALMQSKIDVQNQIITLLQTEIEMQNEKISSQESQVKELATKLQDLQEQVGGLVSQKLNSENIESRNKDDDNQKNALEVADSSSDTKNKNPPVEVKEPEAAEMSVAEMARQTAEAVAATSGFVYDENSGLYYDFSTGYYYDPNRQLYYNGHTRTYYTYDESTKEYSFHSQLPPQDSPSGNENRAKKNVKKSKVFKNMSTQTSQRKTKPAKKHEKEKKTAGDETEEGELSSSSGESEMDSDNSVSIIERPEPVHDIIYVDSHSDEDEQVSEKENPPCIRAIVQTSEGTSPLLKKGSLFIVTCMGGTIGREGDNHTILIPDPAVNKNHAKITYNYAQQTEVTVIDEEDWDADMSKNTGRRQKKYFVTDMGSLNGTFLNRNRLSPANTKSEPFEIQHGSTLQIMDTELLLHIHSGTKTCGHCEPGLLIEKEVVVLHGPVVTQAQRESQRRKALRKMRQKYSIGHLQTGIIPKLVEKYKDRAEDRRKVIGSDHHAFKLPEDEPASIHVPIDKQNKGFKMLQKMGWSEGKGLGPSGESSLREPVKFEVKSNRAGLGSSSGTFGQFLHENYSDQLSTPSPSRGKRKMKKATLLKKTAERYFVAEEMSNQEATLIPSSD